MLRSLAVHNIVGLSNLAQKMDLVMADILPEKHWAFQIQRKLSKDGGTSFDSHI